jgi:hypothetical protein
MLSTLRTDLLHALDPVRFVQDVTGWDVDPWQREVLTSEADRIILNCCRQSGKSTTAGLLALHTAAYTPDSLVLLLSPSLRQSSELFQVVHRFYGAIASDAPARRESALRLELRNGSRIISLPGQEGTVRGYSGVSLLIVDEASRVPDALYHAISPMLAVSNGKMALLSTPFGKRGFFFEVWDRSDDWQKILITAEQCPRISADFLKRERASMPSWFWKQEYACSFEESQASVFEWSAIEEAAKGKVGQWRL